MVQPSENSPPAAPWSPFRHLHAASTAEIASSASFYGPFADVASASCWRQGEFGRLLAQLPSQQLDESIEGQLGSPFVGLHSLLVDTPTCRHKGHAGGPAV